MYKEMESDNKNNIGLAIQYFRETYHISQSKLCKGLCSVSTLSRVEAGERDVDAFILETLLERLGKLPNQYELIVSDLDYETYHRRTKIVKLIDDGAIEEAYRLIKDYEELAYEKGSPHEQFVLVCRARINELKGGPPETTIEILMEAISCTVPDFNTNEISDYFLSSSEFNIILDLLHKMISLEMNDGASKILDQIINYLYWHNHMEQNTSIYPKVAVIGGRFLLEQKDFDRALRICDKGIEMNKSSRRIGYLGELNFIKAQVLENKYRDSGLWEAYDKEECVSLYLKAYHLFNFFDDDTKADTIRKILQEEYKWVDID